MPKRSAALSLVLVVVVCLAAWLVSCSKGGSPTSPTGTTGGGTGGGGGAAPELSGTLAAGASYSHTFNTAGTFNYHCTYHATCGSLAGTIVVVPAATGIQSRVLAITQSGGTSGIYTTTCSGLSVSRDTVHVGDTITWTNNSPFAHNVISQ